MSLTDDSLVPQNICQNRFRMFKVSPAQYSARSDEITALRAAKSAPTGLRTVRNNKKNPGCRQDTPELSVLSQYACRHCPQADFQEKSGISQRSGSLLSLSQNPPEDGKKRPP